MGVLSVTKQVGGYVLGDGVHVAATLTPFGQDVNGKEIAEALADHLNGSRVNPVLKDEQVYFRVTTNGSMLCIKKGGATVPVASVAGESLKPDVLSRFIKCICPPKLHEIARRAANKLSGLYRGAKHAPSAPRQ